MKEIIRDAIIAAFSSMVDSAKGYIISTSYTLALLGGTISVIMYVAGWNKGLKVTGILVMAHTLIRGLLG